MSIGGKAAAKDSKAIAASVVAKEKCTDLCVVCDKIVKKSDFGLGCEICFGWFHTKCVEVSDEEYTFLDNHKSVHWYCKSCNKSVANIIKLVSSLTLKIENIETSVTALTTQVTKNSVSLSDCEKRVGNISDGKLPENLTKCIESKINEAIALVVIRLDSFQEEVKGLKDQVAENETKLETAIEAKLVESVDSIKKELEPSWASIVGQEVNTKFETVSKDVTLVKSVLEDTRKKATEERDRENRAHNIIMYRVPEVDNKDERVQADKAFCIELFNTVLEVDTQESEFKSFRLGKRDQANRPLMIQCRDKSLKNRIMESLNKLKSSEPKFRNISVTHDLTLNERAECKTLIEQAKLKQAEETGEYLWRVRGLPGQLKLIKLKKN